MLSPTEAQLKELEEEEYPQDYIFPTPGDNLNPDGTDATILAEENDPDNWAVTINGDVVRIWTERVCSANFKGHKTWDKHHRAHLDSERQALFLKSAQNFLLSKGNKLKVFSMDVDDF